MIKFIKEFNWQRKYYLNGTLTFLAYKFGIIKSPTLPKADIYPFFNKRRD